MSESTTDPRLSEKGDPRMVSLMKSFGVDKVPPAPPITKDSSREEKLTHYHAVEAIFHQLLNVMFPESEDVGTISETVVVKGVDNNDIDLFVTTPANKSGPLPCFYFIHGGGMCILDGDSAYYRGVRRALTKLGAVVVGVQFRNSAGSLGAHHFPAGLNDCVSGLQWVHANRDTRGISKVVVCGESGGGNLSCAVALKAKQDNILHMLDGVYAMCPFIYGLYGEGDAEEAKLPSLAENDGILLTGLDMGIMSSLYLPDGLEPKTTPLAWPYWASAEDMEGLPPHVISVNELDPLYSEGMSYFRRLLAAGVRARGRTVNGTVHAGELMYMNTIPEVFHSTAMDMLVFANSEV